MGLLCAFTYMKGRKSNSIELLCTIGDRVAVDGFILKESDNVSGIWTIIYMLDYTLEPLGPNSKQDIEPYKTEHPRCNC